MLEEPFQKAFGEEESVYRLKIFIFIFLFYFCFSNNLYIHYHPEHCHYYRSLAITESPLFLFEKFFGPQVSLPKMMHLVSYELNASSPTESRCGSPIRRTESKDSPLAAIGKAASVV